MRLTHTHQHKNAFTLIELLVVISIIGVLVALLIPALSEARLVSQETADSTGLKQVGVALHSYAADNKDWGPHRQSFLEDDGIGSISASNSGRIAGASAMSGRQANSVLTRGEDGVTLSGAINVPTGLGQLVSSVQFAGSSTDQSGTTYIMHEEYVKARELFAKSDQLNDEPNRPIARNHWWRFADVAFKAPRGTWGSNPYFNGLQWPSGAATAASSSNTYFRPTWHYRGADYATANADDSLTGNNDIRNFRMSAPVRHGKVMAMSRDPNTVNYYGKTTSVGCHLMLNDGSVQFSTNVFWRGVHFNSGSGWVRLPSGSGPQPNPYTGENGVQGYKITNSYAYADKYMLK